MNRIAHRWLLLAAAAASLSSSGCVVGSVYAYKANNAAATLEQARVLGADRLAQFEYYFAVENLEKAKEEAAEASYGDAIHFADLAGEYAEKAVQLSRDAHQRGGR